MSTNKFFTLKEAKLNNNCPECYSSDGLRLTFKQKFTENTFYKAITNETSQDMYCHNCNTAIYPIQWTNDIEQVVDYQKRAVQPKSKSTKLKPLAWILFLLILIVVAVLVLLVSGVISF